MTIKKLKKTPRTKTTLEWKRARVYHTDVGTSTNWFSRCGRYCVNRLRWNDKSYPTEFRAILHTRRHDPVRGDTVSVQILSRHRTRKAAQAACLKHARSLKTG